MAKSPVSSDNSLRDKVGFWVSMACAVHCVAMPVIFLIAPAISARIQGLEWLEYAAAGLAFGLTVAQLWPEYLHHRRPGALYLAGGGIALLLCGLALENNSTSAFGPHTWAMVAGSLLMASAFYLGHRLRHHRTS